MSSIRICSSGRCATNMEPGPHRILRGQLVSCGASLPNETGFVSNPSNTSKRVGTSPPKALTVIAACHGATSFATISDPSCTFGRPKRSLASGPAMFFMMLHTISSVSKVVLKYTLHVRDGLRMFCGLSLESLPILNVVSPRSSSLGNLMLRNALTKSLKYSTALSPYSG